MTIWQKVQSTWAALWGDPVRGGLSVHEFEEWEFLESKLEWKGLSPTEQEWFDQLTHKRGL